MKKLAYDPKYSRLRKIAGVLVLNKPEHPPAPYANLDKDWNRIRLQAVKDFKQGASWQGSLKSITGITIDTPVEIDQACDLADEIKKLVSIRNELDGKLDLLR